MLNKCSLTNHVEEIKRITGNILNFNIKGIYYCFKCKFRFNIAGLLFLFAIRKERSKLC